MITIRPAEIDDIPLIAEIYNDAVLNTTATFDTEPKSIEDRLVWFRNHGTKYPVLVAGSENKIVGWASLTQWSDRCAYEKTAEVSVYVHKDTVEKGLEKCYWSNWF